MQKITPFLWFKDRAQAARVVGAMLQMTKIEIKKLKQAAAKRA